MSVLDEILKVAGGAAGYYFGGPVGAGLGRAGAGMLTGENTSNALKNAAMTGIGTYGLQSGANYLGGTEMGKEYAPWLSSLGQGGNMGNSLGWFGGGGGSTPATGDRFGNMSLSPSGSIQPAGGGGGAGGFSLGGNNMIPWMMGAGVLSDVLTGTAKNKQQEELNANTVSSLNEYLNKATWNPETRAEYQKGIMGEYGDMIAGAQRRAGATGADAGRGGGFYGSQTERSSQAAREAVARAMAQTYQPSTVNPAVYQALAQAKTGPTPWWTNLTEGIGTTAGKWPYLALMNAYGGRG